MKGWINNLLGSTNKLVLAVVVQETITFISILIKPTIKSIQDLKAIEVLDNSIYTKVNSVYILSPIFDKVAAVPWESWMPIMYDFLCTML